MVLSLDIPTLSYAYLGKRANEFLRDHHAWQKVPVPIEEIIEFDLRLDIIPIPGLDRDCEITAFISNDLRSITVDQDLMERQYPRYRFSLAHELAHLLVHAEVFARYPVHTIEEYRAFRSQISEVDYYQLEAQADMLAGRILVPGHHLEPRFSAAKALVEQRGLSGEGYWEKAKGVIADKLAREFCVSQSVVEIELRRSHLV